ncbi:MAG: 2,3,4,5-tetrahydropyridine-2,6-dicarboxylate N-succinyltransferase [Legionellales bacterium]|nr:2,3,4,5-tetrahydropyridine-2,6-dicarboxylate N-succinyltransferase [Legionellales bacterium]
MTEAALSTSENQNCIENAWKTREQWTKASPPAFLKPAIENVLAELELGKLRVAEKTDSGWIVNEWVKQTILLYFAVFDNAVIEGGFTQFYDKVALQFSGQTNTDYQARGVRIVPPAVARRGAFLGKGTVLMPSYVNIGAYVGMGTMIDTWATIGSCAQIGNNVHISGGVGIGGVLEPLQATPTIIEDNCFIGARSEIVEGVIVEEGAVISMGVFIGQSTRIYDRTTGKTFYGRVPKNAVVVPGTLPSKDGEYALSAAIIVKYADKQTRDKVGINALLRPTE